MKNFKPFSGRTQRLVVVTAALVGLFATAAPGSAHAAMKNPTPASPGVSAPLPAPTSKSVNAAPKMSSKRVSVTTSKAAKTQPTGVDRTALTTTYWSYVYFAPGDFIRSNKALLTFQSDGNFVVYDENGRARWASNTVGRGTHAVYQSDGNLVVYNGSRATWASGTCCTSSNVLAVQDDGNVVIYRSNGTAAWATNTWH